MGPSPAPSVALLAMMFRSTLRTHTHGALRPSTRSLPLSTSSAIASRPDGSQSIAMSRRRTVHIARHENQCPKAYFSSSILRAADSSSGKSAHEAAESTARAAPSASEPQSAFSQLSSWSRSMTRDSGQAPRRMLEEYGVPTLQLPEHHIYVYAHRHNTHVTLTGPRYPDPKTNRMRQDIILTLSAGNIGYRKGQRGSFDAGYQLGSYFMSRLKNDGLLLKIQRLELVLRGFGNGREAFTKLMLGQEGSSLRDRVVRVVDASRLKFGGQRAPKPRRLG